MEMSGIGFVCCVSVLVLLLCGVESRNNVVTKELYKHLFLDSDYQTDLLPVCEPGNHVNVSLDIALRQIINLVCTKASFLCCVFCRTRVRPCIYLLADLPNCQSVCVSFIFIFI